MSPPSSTEPDRPTIVVTAPSRRLSVMVSSTSLDLPEHREQVIEAILRMGHFPLAMEHGSAKTDADAISMSLEMVDKADVYVGPEGCQASFRSVFGRAGAAETSLSQ